MNEHKKTVLIVGEVKPHTLARYYSRGFRSLGWQVEEVDLSNSTMRGSDTTPPNFEGVGGLSRRAAGLLRREGVRVRQALSDIRGALLSHRQFLGGETVEKNKVITMSKRVRPTLVLVINGLGFTDEDVHDIRAAAGGPVVFYHTEDFLAVPETHPASFEGAIAEYDVIFTSTAENINEYPKWGADRTEFLPFGFDEVDHQPSALSRSDKEKFGADVCFVGKWWFEREKLLEELADHFEVALWGPGWEKCASGSTVIDCWRGGRVVGRQMGKVYSASKLSINNITRRPNRHGHLMRTFEIPACGGVQVSERTDETLEFFEEGEEILCYSSIEECVETVGRYLADDQERERVRHNGYWKCRNNENSYSDRAALIASLV